MASTKYLVRFIYIPIFLVIDIRNADVIDESNLPPGNLMWKTLPSFFIDRGIQITGWPQNVLFPTQKVNPDSVRKSGQGIKDIGTNAARLLAEALINSPCSVKAKRVSKRGKSLLSHHPQFFNVWIQRCKKGPFLFLSKSLRCPAPGGFLTGAVAIPQVQGQ